MGHRRELQSGCFVVDPSDLGLTEQGSIHWAQVIGDGDAARAISLFYIEARTGRSPVISPGSSEAVLYLMEGDCQVSICNRVFEVVSGSGVHVRPNEQFELINSSEGVCRWLVCICPGSTGIELLESASGEFDRDFPRRTVSGREQRSQSTEDRSYKLLVGPAMGSDNITQFIGRIPLSKAPEHFHLYEEAICILSGHGRMWTGDRHAEVSAGSMIFLPRKQVHSLECLDENGMELMGMFYPAGSPAINYKTGQ